MWMSEPMPVTTSVMSPLSESKTKRSSMGTVRKPPCPFGMATSNQRQRSALKAAASAPSCLAT